MCLIPFAAAASERPRAVFAPTIVNFGTTIQGTSIVGEFALHNDGVVPLRIRALKATAPLRPERVPAYIGPGARIALRVHLDTTTLNGAFEGVVRVSLDDPGLHEAHLTMQGHVIPPIQVTPLPAVFIAAERGERKEASVEIVNHEREPLAIEAVEHSSEQLATRLDTVEAGRRYRLTVLLHATGRAGKYQDVLRIRTSRSESRGVTIPVYIRVRERVYTFPDAVDLGALRLSDIEQDPDLLARTAQTLMIYQSAGSDFQVRLRSDLPELDLRSQRGPQGDRYQVTVSLIRANLRPGAIRGAIVIETNDPQFPEVTVPVSGAILDVR